MKVEDIKNIMDITDEELQKITDSIIHDVYMNIGINHEIRIENMIFEARKKYGNISENDEAAHYMNIFILQIRKEIYEYIQNLFSEFKKEILNKETLQERNNGKFPVFMDSERYLN